MRSSSTASFRKLPTCPATETLLRHAHPNARGGAVAEHVTACDFCGAEIYMLSRFPPPADVTAPARAPLPEPLRRLAEDLLSLPSHNRARFAESLLELDRLTLTDA